MGAEVIGGLALAAGGIIGSAMSARSAQTANAQNIAASKEINDANIAFQRATNVENRVFTKQMYNQQVADVLSFFDKQNARQDALIADERLYSSPAAQRQRLKQAGLNAALMGLDGNGSSNVGQVSSIANPSPVQGSAVAPKADMYAQYEPTNYQSIADALNNSATLFFDNKLKAAQTKGLLQDIDFNSEQNPYKLAYLRQQIDESVSRMRKNHQDTRFVELQGDLMDATMADQIKMAQFNAVNTELQGNVLREQALKFETDRLYTQLQGSIALERLGMDKQMQRYLIQETLSKISVNESIANLNAEQQHLVVQQALTESARAEGLKIDNERARAVADELISAAKLQTKRNEGINRAFDASRGFRSIDTFLNWSGDKFSGFFRFFK